MSEDHIHKFMRYDLQRLIKTIYEAQSTIVIVGAGVSTDAGIPDFRSPGGLYRSVIDETSGLKGQDILDTSILQDDAKLAAFCKYATVLRDRIARDEIKPTRIHRWLAKLESNGRLKRCYTQNFDCLEERSGMINMMLEHEPNEAEDIVISNGTVVQLHGSLGNVRCTNCSVTLQWTDEHSTDFMSGTQPECPICHQDDVDRATQGKRLVKKRVPSYLRPDIVLYGQTYHPGGEVIQRIIDIDIHKPPQLLMVIGTELKIPAVRDLVRTLALSMKSKDGSKSVMVNRTNLSAPIKELVDVFVQMSCDDFMDACEELSPHETQVWHNVSDPKSAKIDWKEQSRRLALKLRRCNDLITRKRSRPTIPKEATEDEAAVLNQRASSITFSKQTEGEVATIHTPGDEAISDSNIKDVQ